MLGIPECVFMCVLWNVLPERAFSGQLVVAAKEHNGEVSVGRCPDISDVIYQQKVIHSPER